MLVYSHALFKAAKGPIVSLCLRPLDQAHGADNLLIFEGRTAAHAFPGKHECHRHIGVDAMPKEVSGRFDYCRDIIGFAAKLCDSIWCDRRRVAAATARSNAA